MPEPLKTIERLAVTAPLGVRFYDAVTRKTVSGGLVVAAYPIDEPRHLTRAILNLTDVYILRDLPGLRGFEYAEDETTPRRFVVEVIDSERRFVPFSFTVMVPHHGVFTWDDPFEVSPPASSPGVPLYSAATRRPPGPMAVLRAELWDAWGGMDGQGGPAAWSVLEAELPEGSIVRGIADEKGRVALMFPYPNPIPGAFGSPAPLPQRIWTIRLKAAYEPLDRVPPLRDLTEILMQAPAEIWADAEMTMVLTEVELKFGQELSVKSQDDAASRLLITPAGSPP